MKRDRHSNGKACSRPLCHHAYAYTIRMNPIPLIEAADLSDRLKNPDCVVVDCRFKLTAPDAGQFAYTDAHIPGARYAHLDKDLARKPALPEGRHPLPEPQQFAQTLSTWGISNSSYVVAYDDVSGAIAARLWWMLRWLGHENVAVLNGGLGAWQQNDFPMETAAPNWQSTLFEPGLNPAMQTVASDEISARLNHGELLLDARAAKRFRGEAEPIDPLAGHVPGAINWPFNKALGSDGRFLDGAELNTLLTETVGQRSAADVIAMCGSGVTACHLLLALQLAGLGMGRLYAGSWSEWICNPSRAIATGD